ncbi:MAG: DUF1573 domain-containing protein [Bacteroidales bacterium]|nr:DUF1573 domain-containing protein [Bacteroidales bacterium]
MINYNKLIQGTVLISLVLIMGCKPKEKENMPKLSINNSEQYYQMQYPRDSHIFKFILSNEGCSVLKIQSIKKSCGCVSVDLPEKEILPGKSETLSVTVSQDRYGLTSQSVLLTTNEPNEYSLHKIKATTEILPIFVFTPSRIVQNLYTDEESQCIIKATMNVSAKIVGLSKSSDWITSLNYNNDNSEIIVNISTKSLNKGQYKDSIILRTNLEKEREISIPVNLIVKSDVCVVPDFVFLGNIKQGNQNTPRFVTVSILGKSPESMNIMISPKDLLNYEIKEDLNCSKVYISLAELMYKGEIDGRIIIKIPNFKEINIPVKGYVY